MSGRTQARACPERTCVGCRERAAKSDLLRIVAIEDECVPDPRGTLPGRGAYVHPAVVCLDQAVRRRAFPRALRSAGALDTANLREAVAGKAGTTA
ncbi:MULTISPECIES: YlxR family protein [Streptomyces]|uniref:DNA-binding protein n=1 Tax=Streptomyces virginiae TaxID=1961 RepID=A0ABQ3NFI0_STRVG|nr:MULTISPECIES: YlxR family protein [Streptomyces]MCI4084075.1 YlxR family protein [Streptomyces sp. MMS21 TC-5]MEC4573221.1 YlxR family protein [Streptomyces sp. CMAA1738]QNE24978.1 YlxR family protein [Streptomyces sp. INR7]RST14569.1 YlxR family protein [Streptomyces sp. WAC05950]GGQ32508.1 DNA-binding protein [Streptomyces virginiae]